MIFVSVESSSSNNVEAHERARQRIVRLLLVRMVNRGSLQGSTVTRSSRVVRIESNWSGQQRCSIITHHRYHREFHQFHRHCHRSNLCAGDSVRDLEKEEASEEVCSRCLIATHSLDLRSTLPLRVHWKHNLCHNSCLVIRRNFRVYRIANLNDKISNERRKKNE